MPYSRKNGGVAFSTDIWRVCGRGAGPSRGNGDRSRSPPPTRKDGRRTPLFPMTAATAAAAPSNFESKSIRFRMSVVKTKPPRFSGSRAYFSVLFFRDFHICLLHDFLLGSICFDRRMTVLGARNPRTPPESMCG